MKRTKWRAGKKREEFKRKHKRPRLIGANIDNQIVAVKQYIKDHDVSEDFVDGLKEYIKPKNAPIPMSPKKPKDPGPNYFSDGPNFNFEDNPWEDEDGVEMLDPKNEEE